MACNILIVGCTMILIYTLKFASWSNASKGIYKGIDGKGVRRRGWVEVDGLGCMIYRWKALLNPYTMVVKALCGTQGYPSNGPDKVTTFCENEIHHISINTAWIPSQKTVFRSSIMYLYNGIIFIMIFSLVPPSKGKGGSLPKGLPECMQYCYPIRAHIYGYIPPFNGA